MFISTGLIRDGSSATQNITSDLSGGLIITKTGTGTLSLSGSNTHTGGITVIDGTLELNNSSAIGPGGLTMSGGTLSNPVGGVAGFTTTGKLNINNSFSISSSTGISLTCSSVVLGTTPTVSLVSGTIANIFSTIESTTNGLTVDGSGIFSLGGPNLYSGTTTVNGTATLEARSPQSLGTVGNVSIGSGATVDFIDTTGTILVLRNVTGSGTLMVANPTTASTTTTNIPTTVNFSGFSGTLRIPTGTAGRGKVNCNTLNSFPATMNIIVNQNSTLYLSAAVTHNAPITLNGGDTGEAIGQLRIENSCVYAGTITLAGNMVSGDSIIGTNTTTATISGSIVESGGARELSKGGSGTLTITNPPSITGGYKINAGTLIVPVGTTAGTITYFGSNTITLNGGTLDVSAGSTANTMTVPNNIVVSASSTLKHTDANQVYSGTITLNGALALTQVYANKGLTISGVISGTGRITRSTAASTTVGLVLGSANGSWSGGLTLLTSGDRVTMNTATSLGTGQFVISTGTTSAGAVLINGTGAAQTISNGVQINGASYFTYDGPNDLTISGTPGTNDFVLSGTGTKNIYVKTGINLIIASSITGAFALSRSASTGYVGTMYLRGTNTFSGAFTLNTGTTIVDSAGTLGGAASITVGNTATLEFGGNTNRDSIGTNNKPITVSTGGTLRVSAINAMGYTAKSNYAIISNGGTFNLTENQYIQALTLTTSGTCTGVGAIQFWFSTTTAIQANATSTIANPIALNNSQAQTFSAASGAVLTLNGAITGAGLTLTGAGEIVFGASNATWTSPITLSMTGVLRTGSSSAFGTGAITVTSSCTIGTMAGGVARTVANNVSVNTGVTLTLAGGNGNLTMSGIISGLGNLTLGSTGTIYLNGVNTISGTVTTASTARVGGTGTVSASALTFITGTTLAPGTGAGNAGTLTVGGNLTLNTGASVAINIGSTTTVARTAVNGNITFNSNAVTFGASALNAGTYTLFTYTGTCTGTLATPTLTGTGRTFGSYSYTGGSVTVTLT